MKIRRSLGFWIHYKSLNIEKQYCTNNKKEEKNTVEILENKGPSVLCYIKYDIAVQYPVEGQIY